MAPAEGGLQVARVDSDGSPGTVDWWSTADAAERMAEQERDRPRWVWADTRALYAGVLLHSVRLERCSDLRLSHAILAGSTYASVALPVEADGPWAEGEAVATDFEPTLLDRASGGAEISLEEVVVEHRRQQQTVHAAQESGRLRLLLAAESAGALIAAEMRHTGLPWSEQIHDRQLTAALGARPLCGGRPARLEALVAQIREALVAPSLNPDSQSELLRALRSHGVGADTTRQWELERLDHPVIEPLLEYKKLARLLSANGWVWMSTWVRDGRFRPDYVPGGVVTGRWATRGGGALQLPRQIRAAVTADPGHRLVVADAAQLEPRILAAMARDEQMAKASQGHDLYQALVDEQVVDTRAHAKVAMLGALYGATSGEAGHLMPRLVKVYPRATGLVEQAARCGERGEIVTTWLGRSSPPPSAGWHQVQRRASEIDAGAGDQRNARRQARDWGRFTRNFVVQGTAAEWALCWMAGLRRRLRAMAGDAVGPELVYFLHDEVIVHAPAALTDQVVSAVHEAADEAGRLMFGAFPVEFAITVACVDNYAQAK